MREGMLEGIVQLGEETRFVEELRRLQMRQARLECRIGQFCKAVQQAEGHLRADDRRGLQQALVLRCQAVDTGGQDGLHRGGHLNGR
jgi:hypothetical protein